MNRRSNEIFAAFLKTRGYAERTIQIYSEVLENFSNIWNTNDPSLLYEHINSTLKKLEPTSTIAAKNNVRAAARQFFLFKSGITYKEHAQKINSQSSYNDILNDFSVYSTEFKRITSNTTKSEYQHIKKILFYLGDVTYDSLLELEAHDIRDYVCTAFQGLKTSSIGKYVTSLRNFSDSLNIRVIR